MLKLRIIPEKLLPHSIKEWPFQLSNNLDYKYIEVDKPTAKDAEQWMLNYLLNLFQLIAEAYKLEKLHYIDMVFVLSPTSNKAFRIEELFVDQYNEDLVLAVRFWKELQC